MLCHGAVEGTDVWSGQVLVFIYIIHSKQFVAAYGKTQI